MKFWNNIMLPAPYLLGCIKELDTNGDYAVGLITDFWDGVTHDLDVLAVNKRKEQIVKTLEDIFLPDTEKKKLEQEPEKLDGMIEDILLSILNTQGEFALLGSEGLSLYNLGGKNTVVLSREDYEQKVIDYFNSAYSWHCKIDGNPDLKKQKPKIRKDFREYMQPLLDIIADESKFIYAQGDEFLHHYQFHTFFYNGKAKVKSGVFDADHSCLNRLERSRAKTLLSHLIDADYETIDNILNKADDKLHVDLHAMSPGSVAKEKLVHLTDPAPNSSRLDFDVIAVYEAICIIGRAAMDDLYNWRHKKSRQMKSVSYRNAHLDFPYETPDMVSLEAYNSGDQIRKVSNRLNERLDVMISGNTRYGPIRNTELLTGLKGIKGILSNFTLPENLPTLPTVSDDDEVE